MPPPFAVRVKTASGWQDIAIQGATGPIGPQGVQGVQGIPGGTMGSAAAWMPAVTLAAVSLSGAWVAVPISPLTIEPTDAFTVSGGIVTVKDAGWYHVAASVMESSATAFAMYISLGTSATLGDGNIANNGSAAQAYCRVGCDGSIKLPAGGKVYLGANCPSAGAVGRCMTFSIERIGGPQGQMEVYTQPDEPPVSAKTGAIWVDTDAPPPSGGNVPAGGTTGQILTKTSNADGAVTWGAAPVSGITGQTYTMSGYAADRVLNAGATTMNEIASVLATLIDDMKTAGLIKP